MGYLLFQIFKISFMLFFN